MCHATANVMNLSRNVLSDRKIHKMKKKRFREIVAEKKNLGQHIVAFGL